MSGLLQQAAGLAATRDALRLQAEKIAQSYLRGPHGRKRAGAGEAFWQFRPYVAGDSPRDIDWRQTAKRDDVFVREREHEAAQGLWLCRDGSASMRQSSHKNIMTKADYAEVIILALGFLALEAGERLGVVGAGARALSHMSALPLAQQQLDAAPLEAALRDSPAARALTVIASDFYFDLTEVERFAAAAAARGSRALLLQVCDPAEEDFDYGGRIRFEDAEGGVTAPALLVDDAAALRQQYREKFDAHRQALAAIARRYGGTLVTTRTDAPPEQALNACMAVLMVERR